MSRIQPPDMDLLTLSDMDSSDEDPFTPAPKKGKKDAQRGAQNDAGAGKTRGTESHYTAEEARGAILRQELESVRNVNKVIEGVVESLQKARDNMDTVSKTVHNASTLLQTWTRILSQTEHNQRLILNPQWQGASQDLADIQNEEIQRQHAAQRREAEAHERREAAARRAEEERRKAEATASGSTRGRGRGTTRPSSGYGRVPSTAGAGRGVSRSASATGTRGGSGIGRGLRGGSRGRGLG